MTNRGRPVRVGLTVSFDLPQERLLRAWARAQGISVSALIREIVDRWMAENPR